MTMEGLSEQADGLAKEAKTITMELFAYNPSFQKSLRHQRVPLRNIQQRIATLMKRYAELYSDAVKETLPAATVKEHVENEKNKIR